MLKVKHITADQINQMVGSALGNELWTKGMMNELRRYPNEIPCSPGEIPSLLIPRSSGQEKVEWGFTAGMSCLVRKSAGKIEIRNGEKFPASALLALLSCWYDAGVLNGKKIKTTLYIPENAKEFAALLSKALPKLTNVTVKQETIPSTSEQKAPTRKAMNLSNSIAVCSGIQGVDIGRFQLTAKCITGSFKIGDAVTITDGSFTVKAEHCLILRLCDRTGRKEIKSTDEVEDDSFGAYVAMWFPNDTEFDGLNIIKEATQPTFTPKTMSEKVEIAEPVEVKKSFFQKLFEKKDYGETTETSASKPTGSPTATLKKDVDTIIASSSLDLSMKAAEKDAFPKSSEAELLKIFADYFAPNKAFYTQPGTPAYTAYFSTIEAAKKEILASPKIFEEATKWTAKELVNMLNNPKPGITNMVLLGLIFRTGWYSVIEDRLICVDFCEEFPSCIALYLLLTAQKKPVGSRKQMIDSGDSSNPKQLQQAINRLKTCDSNWNPVILNAMK